MARRDSDSQHRCLSSPPLLCLRCALLAVCLLLLTCVRSSSAASHVIGAIPVDEKTLPRLSSVADVLVKVDKSYPYGDDQDQFKSFCERYADASDRIRDDFFIAVVGVEGYGDKHNQALARRLGAGDDEDKYPQYFFMKKGSKDVTKADHYAGSDKSADALASYVKRLSGIRLGDVGTLDEMDVIAARFVPVAASNDAGKMDALMKEAEKQKGKYTAQGDKDIADVYLKVMAKAAQKGHGYFESETKRVGRMLEDGKMSKDKRRVFDDKLKVLGSFTSPAGNDEL